MSDEQKQVEEVRETTTQEGNTTVNRTEQASSVETPKTAGPMTIAERLVYYILGVIQMLLVLRFVLSLLGANRQNAFASFVYDVSHPFAQPFFDLFSYKMQYGTSRLEVETLVAMVVYGLIGAGIAALIRLPRRDQTPTA